jgi:hypothetical protein
VNERNTYGLPTGEAIRRELVRVFREQRHAALGVVSAFKSFKADQDLPGAGMPNPLIPDVAWDSLFLGPLEMSERFVPLLQVIWDQSGRDLLARIGEDPEDWRVEDPNLQATIQQSALAFCEATNSTTSQQLDAALAATRNEIGVGGSVASLTKRINDIFDGAETWRARRIATSEASRGYHAAEVMSAKQSGVVAGFELLLSEDACPLCRTVARRCPAVRIGQPFAVIGDHPDYSTIAHPPIHVSCQCSMTEVLIPEYGGPASVPWGTTLDQPEAEEEDEQAYADYRPEAAGRQKPKLKPEDTPAEYRPRQDLGIKVVAYGSPPAQWGQECENVVAALPEKLRKQLSDAGVNIAICERTTDHDPSLAYQRPRGYPEGWTRAMTDGMYRPDSKTVVVARKMADPSGEDRISTRSAAVLRHELGHAVDFELGVDGYKANHSIRCLESRFKDTDIATDETKANLSYFFQLGDAGPEEIFAESFAWAAGGGTTPKFPAAFPSSIEYAESILRGETP